MELIYDKEMLLNGAYTSQACKRISRTLTDVNEVYPSLHTKISSLLTAAMADSQKSHDIVINDDALHQEIIYLQTL
jgi:hypothetical protein